MLARNNNKVSKSVRYAPISQVEVQDMKDEGEAVNHTVSSTTRRIITALDPEPWEADKPVFNSYYPGEPRGHHHNGQGGYQRLRPVECAQEKAAMSSSFDEKAPKPTLVKKCPSEATLRTLCHCKRCDFQVLVRGLGGEPPEQVRCYCRDCRRFHSSAFGAYVVVALRDSPEDWTFGGRAILQQDHCAALGMVDRVLCSGCYAKLATVPAGQDNRAPTPTAGGALLALGAVEDSSVPEALSRHWQTVYTEWDLAGGSPWWPPAVSERSGQPEVPTSPMKMHSLQESKSTSFQVSRSSQTPLLQSANNHMPPPKVYSENVMHHDERSVHFAVKDGGRPGLTRSAKLGLIPVFLGLLVLMLLAVYYLGPAPSDHHHHHHRGVHKDNHATAPGPHGQLVGASTTTSTTTHARTRGGSARGVTSPPVSAEDSLNFEVLRTIAAGITSATHKVTTSTTSTASTSTRSTSTTAQPTTTLRATTTTLKTTVTVTATTFTTTTVATTRAVTTSVATTTFPATYVAPAVPAVPQGGGQAPAYPTEEGNVLLPPVTEAPSAQGPDFACHDAQKGESCYEHVSWAMRDTRRTPSAWLRSSNRSAMDVIRRHPEWFKGIRPGAGFADFQYAVYRYDPHICPKPCWHHGCHDARPGESCYRDVDWAMRVGIWEHPEWYPRLVSESRFEEFQEAVHMRNASSCPRPCKDTADARHYRGVPGASIDLPPVSTPFHDRRGLTFYVYRAQGQANTPLENVAAGDLSGVMWYLHNEVIGGMGSRSRRHNITRIVRYKVTTKTTWAFYNVHRRQFGGFVAFNTGKCTVPNCNAYWQHFGFIVGCQFVNKELAAYEASSKTRADCRCKEPGCCNNPVWYSFPGACPSERLGEKTQQCAMQMPGGHCDMATGDRSCTYSFEEAGDVTLDELLGIKDYSAVLNSGNRNYLSQLAGGMAVSFWDGMRDRTHCRSRLDRVKQLFDEKYPQWPACDDLSPPPCDFDAYYPDELSWPAHDQPIIHGSS